jgi:hypothetical protein
MHQIIVMTFQIKDGLAQFFKEPWQYQTGDAFDLSDDRDRRECHGKFADAITSQRMVDSMDLTLLARS